MYTARSLCLLKPDLFRSKLWMLLSKSCRFNERRF